MCFLSLFNEVGGSSSPKGEAAALPFHLGPSRWELSLGAVGPVTEDDRPTQSQGSPSCHYGHPDTVQSQVL